jgi:uncharacterized protein GlcG (DUF336 family)
MTVLTLAKANTIIEAALRKAAELKLKPLTVAVVDAGGHTIALQRQDGSPFMRPQVATGKAFAAIAMGANSRALGTMAVERPHFFQGVSGVSGGKMIPVAGGVVVKDGGTPVGAVGISGDTSDNDEIAAIAGIEAAGFTAG